MPSNNPDIDLVSAASYAHGQPHEQFRWLREHDPVHWHEQKDARGFWAVTRYHDVWTIGRDAKSYSSSAGGIMLDDPDEFSLQQSRSMMLHMDPRTIRGIARWSARSSFRAVRMRSSRASRSSRKVLSTTSSSAANAT